MYGIMKQLSNDRPTRNRHKMKSHNPLVKVVDIPPMPPIKFAP